MLHEVGGDRVYLTIDRWTNVAAYQSAAEGAAGNFYAWEAYSTQQVAVCATLTFMLHSTAAMNYDPPLIEFDSVAERAVFVEIASTFIWLGP